MSQQKLLSTLMEGQLRTFLDARRISSKDVFSHTSKIPPGRFWIPEDDEDDFLSHYCTVVTKGYVLSLTEKPSPYAPLRLDFDMKASLEVGLERQYTRDMLLVIIKMVQDFLRASIKSDEFVPKNLYCLLMEKPGPRDEKGEVKDGFHLHFPHFICERWFADMYLRNHLIEKVTAENVFEGATFTTTVKDMIDPVHTKVWFMYGSSKDPAVAYPYLVTAAFDDECNEVELDTVFEEEMDGRQHEVTHYLPRFLSVKGHTELTPLKDEVEKKKEEVAPKKRKKIVFSFKKDIAQILADLKQITDGGIMDMLSDSRADDYDEWMDVGWTLFNIGQGEEEALNMWIAFSRRSGKFEDGVCEELWTKMSIQGKTMGSLLAMAKKDSPELYKTWKDSQISTYMYKSLRDAKPNECSLAEICAHLYTGRFVCATQQSAGCTWYEFKNHRWQMMNGESALRRAFFTEVNQTYIKFQQRLLEEKSRLSEGDTKFATLDIQQKKALQIEAALRTCTFTDKLVRMCKLYLEDCEFEEKKDENKKIFGCQNCVLDLQSGLAREGRSDDYVTLSSGIDYMEFTEDDDEVIAIRSLLEKVYPDPELRNYFLDSACKILEGGNVDKSFIVHTGGGNNAKSIIFKLLELTFGNYCHKFPRELLVMGRGNSSGSARPELAAVKGKRLAIVQELGKSEVMNVGVLRELTGNDSFFCRGLFKDGSKVSPMFTLMMMCNEPPKIPDSDEATWNRVRLLDYESKFVLPDKLNEYPVPPTPKEQMEMKRFHANPHFDNELPALAPAFLWMLFQRYRKYRESGFKTQILPKKVRISTSMYRSLNDVYQQFVQDRTEKIEGLVVDEEYRKRKDAAFLNVNVLYSEYDTWFTQNYKSYVKDKVSKIAFLHEMNKKLRNAGKQGKISGWFGYKIPEDVQDEENKNAVVAQGNVMSKLLAAKK